MHPLPAPGPWMVPWGVVVPVKRLGTAKTRLGGYGDILRRRLALAFATDVVRACLDCPAVARVLVMTDDDEAGRALAALGARVETDGSPADRGPDDDDDDDRHGSHGSGLNHPSSQDRPSRLNAALARGADLLRDAGDGSGVAAVPADLAALRADDLARVLRSVGPGRRAFVRDRDGRGTTVLAAAPGEPLSPSYGPGSAARHLAGGAEPLTAAAGVQLDVDVAADLMAAIRLGAGAATTAVCDQLTPDDGRRW